MAGSERLRNPWFELTTKDESPPRADGGDRLPPGFGSLRVGNPDLGASGKWFRAKVGALRWLTADSGHGGPDPGATAILWRMSSFLTSGRMAERFRGYLPVIVDVETGGFDCARHALLEIAVCPLQMGEDGSLCPGEITSTHVEPFPGSELDPKSLEVTGIDVDHPFRAALPEREALNHVFLPVRQAVRQHACQRAILVGHNASFDLGFLNAAVARTQHKRNPFHPFSTFDTVSLAGLAVGQTVLSRAVQAIGLEWSGEQAHSAVYDTERTAQLFCHILNRWRDLHELEATVARAANAA